MSVEWKTCRCGVKRDFMSRRNAERALGRAQTKRGRRADAVGTRRGLRIEHRVYECERGGWHLTAQSRASHESAVKAAGASREGAVRFGAGV
ncbi:hypothetical protein AB0E27_31250 [Streptomyces sparsogenes]|uniref:hypothetical protein n=1 Tax=Streptomyces sparsogenes TaxID=67365 RepID=UPI0033D69778